MDQFITVLLAATVLVAIGFAGLSITIILKKGGRFPVTSIGRNRAMQKRGINCVKHEEMICRGNGKKGGSCCG